MTPEGSPIQTADAPTDEAPNDDAAGTPTPDEHGGGSRESVSPTVWAMGIAADAVGPVEWWPPTRLKPYTPRHVRVPVFRGTPSWAILQHLVRESGIREPVLRQNPVRWPCD